MSAPGGGGDFRLGGAYIEVHLRDETRDDERDIRRRWESAKITLTVQADKASAAREGRSAATAFSTAARRSGALKLAPEADRLSSERAGFVAGLAFTKAAQRHSAQLKIAADERQAGQAGDDAGQAFAEGFTDRGEREGRTGGRKVGESFGRQAGLSIGQSAKLWGAAIIAATPVLGTAMAAGFAAGLAGIAAASAATNADIRQDFAALKSTALGEIRALGEGTEGVFRTQIAIVDDALTGLGPRIADSVNAGSAGITQLTRGVIDFTEGALPGAQAVVENSLPIFSGWRNLLDDVGDSVGDMGRGFASQADRVGLATTQMSGIIDTALGLANRAVQGGTNALATHGGQVNATLSSVSANMIGLSEGAAPVLGAAFGHTAHTITGLATTLGLGDEALGSIAATALTTWGAFRLSRTAVSGLDTLGGKMQQTGQTAEGAQTRMGRWGTSMSRMASAGGAIPLVGLAFGALSLVLGEVGAREAEQAQRTAEIDQNSQKLVGSLNQVNGELTDQSRKLLDNTLSAAQSTDAFRRFGVNADTAAEALSGNETAMIRMNVAASAASAEIATSGANLSDQQKRALQAAQSWPEYVRQVMEARRALAEFNARSAGAEFATAQLDEALKGFSDTTADAAKRANDLVTALNILRGNKVSVTEAMAEVGDSIRDLADVDWGGIAIDGKGYFNALTEAGGDLSDKMGDVQQNFSAVATAMAENGEPAAVIADRLRGIRDRMIDAAVAAGANRSEVETLFNRYGLLPEEIATRVSQVGMNDVQAAALALSGHIRGIPNDKTVRVAALSDVARRKLEALGLKVRQMPDGSFEIYATDKKGRETLQNILRTVDDSNGTVDIFGNSGPFNWIFGGALRRLNASRGSIEMRGDARPADRTREAARRRINSTSGMMPIYSRDAGATRTARSIRDRISGMRATIGVSAAGVGFNSLFNARGNINEPHSWRHRPNRHYADGGIGESVTGGSGFVVQPGQLRTFGDNPRYPELFAVLDPANQRSAQLIVDANRRLGDPVGRARDDMAAMVSAEAQRARSALAGQREHGGPLVPRLPYLVGERGPEVVSVSQPAQVTPANRSAPATAQRGGDTYYVTLNLSADTVRSLGDLLAVFESIPQASLQGGDVR